MTSTLDSALSLPFDSGECLLPVVWREGIEKLHRPCFSISLWLLWLWAADSPSRPTSLSAEWKDWLGWSTESPAWQLNVSWIYKGRTLQTKPPAQNTFVKHWHLLDTGKTAQSIQKAASFTKLVLGTHSETCYWRCKFLKKLGFLKFDSIEPKKILKKITLKLLQRCLMSLGNLSLCSYASLLSQK